MILNYHGRIPEEYVFLGKGGTTSKRALESLEAWAVRKSDHVVVVSHKLAEYLEDRYKLPKAKISMIPCATDSQLFRWDPDLRKATRKRLGYNGNFVCTHVGSFFKSALA